MSEMQEQEQEAGVPVARLNEKPVELPTEEKDNVIFVIQGQIGLEAIEDKILVKLDKFKSGYECKDCNETGVYIACECLRAGREFGVNANGKTCSYREGCSRQIVGERCQTCKGTGSTIVIPQTSRGIPTSGRIISKGPLVTKRRIGERVVFGAHTGYALPFKGNINIRVMREDEPMCLIHAIDNEHVLGDFMHIDEPIDNREN